MQHDGIGIEIDRSLERQPWDESWFDVVAASGRNLVAILDVRACFGGLVRKQRYRHVGAMMPQ